MVTVKRSGEEFIIWKEKIIIPNTEIRNTERENRAARLTEEIRNCNMKKPAAAGQVSAFAAAVQSTGRINKNAYS